MKNLLLAMLLAAISLTTVLVFLGGDGADANGARRPPDARARAPEQFPVLTARNGAMEVLLRPRFADTGRLIYTDRSFTEALGIRAGKWTFLEAVVVNTGDDPISDVDPSTIALVRADGESIPARDLRDLAGADPTAKVLLDAFSTAENTPLAARSSRRLVVAVPAGEKFSRFSAARWMGLELSPAVAGRHALESWLGKPKLRFLEAVLEEDAGSEDGRE